MAQKNETAVVVQDRTRSNALVGSIDERIKAFDQIATGIAGLALNGWDNVQKAKAACWLADAAGMHPAIFMQNHYVMPGKSGLLVEPKWEFIVATLQSRVPNFKFEVLIETDDCAEVKMSDGKNEHVVRYTLADAKRQGLLSRGGNAWTAGNTREMCFKQAVKRCGRRIGAAALMDLPVGLADDEVLLDGGADSAPTVAQAIARELGGAEDTPFEEIPQAQLPPPESETVEELRARLAEMLVGLYGKQSKAVMAEKASIVYNAAMLEKTGKDPNVSFKPGAVRAEEARLIIEYLEAREAGKASEPAEPSAPLEDEAPPTEDPEPEEAPTTQGSAHEAMMVQVNRAIKLFGRKFIQEAPAGSEKWWFVDGPILSQTGDKTAVKFQEKGFAVAPVEKFVSLTRLLEEACDEKERGGR